MMIFFLTAVAALAVVHVESSVLPRDTGDSMAANINAMLDNILSRVSKKLNNSQYDPMPLPDAITGFSKKGLFGTNITGRIGVNHGEFTGLSTIHRVADSTFDYEESDITVHAILGFDEATISYDFEAQFMNIGPKGTVKAKADDLVVDTTLKINLVNMTMEVVELHLTDASDLKFKIEGLHLLDVVIDVVADFVLAIFKTVVLKAAENIVAAEVRNATASIDLGSIIG